MKGQAPIEKKERFVALRADGYSFSHIATELKISKATCHNWNKELEAEILERKADRLNDLYKEYGLHKEARIKSLGAVVARMAEAIQSLDLHALQPEKLLDLYFKYNTALKDEYTGEAVATRNAGELTLENLYKQYINLLERTRAGEITKDQAKTEIEIIKNLLTFYLQDQKSHNNIEAPVIVDDISQKLLAPTIFIRGIRPDGTEERMTIEESKVLDDYRKANGKQTTTTEN